MYLVGFPLLLIPFAIYNIIAFLMPGVSWSAPVTHVRIDVGRRLDDVGRRHLGRLHRAAS